jgi:hypothetical protein
MGIANEISEINFEFKNRILLAGYTTGNINI